MSERLEIKVDRTRSSCPYCKGDVTGGHVWLCPACAAPHHTDCMNEHGACATCGHRAASGAKPPTDAELVRFRQAISSLGFAILREDERELLALHPTWQGQAHLVQLVTSDTLTRDQVEADVTRLSRDPLAQGNASLLHLARRIEPGAHEWLRTSASARSRNAFACVPMVWTSGALTTPQGWLGDAFPLHAEVARSLVNIAVLRGPARASQPPPAAVHGAPAPPTGLVRPLPEPTTPPRPDEQASARDVTIAIAAALAVGITLLAALAALT